MTIEWILLLLRLHTVGPKFFRVVFVHPSLLVEQDNTLHIKMKPSSQLISCVLTRLQLVLST